MTVKANPTVLVTGGSVAGPALSWSLLRAGYRVTMLERAAAIRDAGQNIDIRVAGRNVLRTMGLHDAVVAEGTGELGMRMYDDRGRPYAEFPVEAGRDGPTAELEILRGKLSRLLLGLTEATAEHRYGTSVTGLDEDGSGVDVTFADGSSERYDLVVIAEGRRSRTRDLVFGDAVSYVGREQYLAYGRIPRVASDDDWWRWLTATNNRMVSLRPDNTGTIRANLTFLAPALGLDRLDHAAQMTVLRERFADVGWETARILDGFAASPDEFYLESADAVRMSSWSRGRVAVVGDAAWGAGPTGMGTTLALVGAYVLAGELAAADGDHGRAFAAYERVMRGYVSDVQNVPRALLRAVLPRTRVGLVATRTAYRVAASPIVRRLSANPLLSGGGEKFSLPRYEVYDGPAADPADSTPRSAAGQGV